MHTLCTPQPTPPKQHITSQPADGHVTYLNPELAKAIPDLDWPTTRQAITARHSAAVHRALYT